MRASLVGEIRESVQSLVLTKSGQISTEILSTCLRNTEQTQNLQETKPKSMKLKDKRSSVECENIKIDLTSLPPRVVQ